MDEDNKTGNLRKDIGELSSSLKNLSNDKESKYQTISKLNDELNVLLKQASELKEQKAKSDAEIREIKKNRDLMNKSVKDLAGKVKDVKTKNKDVPQSRERTESPLQLASQLENLNMRMQTEVMSFEKEQKLMSIMKELKGKLKVVSALDQSRKDFNNANQQLREAKSKADYTHKTVQDLAAKNAEIFMKLSEVSKRIAILKEERDTLKKDVGSLKSRIHGLNQELADKLSTWSSAKKQNMSTSRQASDKAIAEKAEAAKDKLSKKQKINTDDILAMQRQAMKE